MIPTDGSAQSTQQSSSGPNSPVVIGNNNTFYISTSAAPPTQAPTGASSPPAQPPSPAPVATARPEDPVDWDFFDPRPEIDAVFGFNVHTVTEQLLVSVITLGGRNLTAEPITNVRAYTIPQNTGTQLPLKFNVGHQHGELAEPSQTYGIPPYTRFKMQYYIPTTDPTNIHMMGIPFNEYLTKYGALQFVFEYDDNRSVSFVVPFAKVKEIFDERQRERDQAVREAERSSGVQRRAE